MTTTSEPPDDVLEDDTAPTADEPDDGQHDVVQDDEREDGSEAARYRRELRDTEDELTSARIVLGMARRAEVERLAGQHLAAPADVFDVGQLNVDDFLDDAGRVDPGRVDTACQGILAARPGLARGPGTAVNEPPAESITWADALQQLM